MKPPNCPLVVEVNPDTRAELIRSRPVDRSGLKEHLALHNSAFCPTLTLYFDNVLKAQCVKFTEMY